MDALFKRRGPGSVPKELPWVAEFKDTEVLLDTPHVKTHTCM